MKSSESVSECICKGVTHRERKRFFFACFHYSVSVGKIWRVHLVGFTDKSEKRELLYLSHKAHFSEVSVLALGFCVKVILT